MNKKLIIYKIQATINPILRYTINNGAELKFVGCKANYCRELIKS